MRILFLSDNFPPEVNAPANRTFEHCRNWAASGAEVTVITCAPNFPEGKLMSGYRNRIFQKETLQGIRVWRVWSYITANKGMLRRTVDYISYAVSASLAALFSKPDVIVATSPQFFTACAGYITSILKGRPWVFEVRDLWPESIKAVGAMKSGLIITLLEKLEIFLYKKASAIVVVTDTFRERLIERGVDAAKISVVKNGVDLSSFSKREKNRELLAKLNLQGKKIILYAGTIGMAHAIDFIVRSAVKLNQFPDFHFVIIGAGAEYDNIKKLVEELAPANLSLLDAVPREQMPAYLSLADFALVNLKDSATFRTVLPSKIFESAAMEIPILLGVEGEARKLIEEYGAGIAFKPENFESLKEALAVLANEPERVAGFRAGAKKLAGDFDRNKLAEKMLEILGKCS